MNQFFLKHGKETFGGSVVPAVSLAAHAAHDPRFSEYLLVAVACVLASPVAVQKQALARPDKGEIATAFGVGCLAGKLLPQ